jgi:hypothetical protein
MLRQNRAVGLPIQTEMCHSSSSSDGEYVAYIPFIITFSIAFNQGLVLSPWHVPICKNERINI